MLRRIQPHRSPSRAFLLCAALVLAGWGCSDGPIGPEAPVVTIASPSAGLEVTEGMPLRLEGSASDPQDGPLQPAALTWASSIDGPLGVGPLLELEGPSVGVHTITLSASDVDGNESTASVSVVVNELDFIDGTLGDSRIGLVVSSLGNALRLFRVGDPSDYRDIPLGASSAVTATGVTTRGEHAVVPLGNAASVALIDVRSRQIESFYLFASGNATGSAFVSETTVLAANQETDQVGRFTIGQANHQITDLVSVAPFPNDVIGVSQDLALVVSANLNDAYAPIGDGVVTAIDPSTMTVQGTVTTGGQNPQFGALGPDGLLYVVNTGDYVAPSSMAVIDPQTLTRVQLVQGLGAGSTAVHVDSAGRVYTSGFFYGTTVWDSATDSFLRGPDNPLCAPLDGGGCRGAFSATTADDGTVFQTFFGSPAQGLSPWVFRYAPGSWELVDSIGAGLGPVDVEVRSFRDR